MQRDINAEQAKKLIRAAIVLPFFVAISHTILALLCFQRFDVLYTRKFWSDFAISVVATTSAGIVVIVLVLFKRKT